jgi:putative tricarboxylic transport membrane protein
MLKRSYQAAALIFMGLGVYILWEGLNLKYYTPIGPGAGFLPFWVGAFLTVLSLIWLVQVSRQRVSGGAAQLVPDRAGARRILSILGALTVCAALLNLLGFSLTMFGFLFFLLSALGRRSLIVTIVITAAGSFGVCYAFEHWLGVLLPKSSLALLSGLGL